MKTLKFSHHGWISNVFLGQIKPKQSNFSIINFGVVPLSKVLYLNCFSKYVAVVMENSESSRWMSIPGRKVCKSLWMQVSDECPNVHYNVLPDSLCPRTIPQSLSFIKSKFFPHASINSKTNNATEDTFHVVMSRPTSLKICLLTAYINS